MSRVVVAMSGGVDSSVTALLLKQQGYDVVGMTMQIWDNNGDRRHFGGCCGLSAIDDAKRVAQKVGIPHYVINLRKVFLEKVVNPFCEEYLSGRTPNPCVLCNQHIKFEVLLKKARQIKAEYLATGHYARIGKSSKSGYLLKKGVDKTKDQSYFLYRLTQNQLKHTLFPLGRYTKTQVRQIARQHKLLVADKPGSQEICFIPNNNYRQFLDTRITQNNVVAELVRQNKKGLIKDTKDNILGKHQGIHLYTIGQRQGLGIAVGKPLYVVFIDAKNNEIVVGEEKELYQDSLIAKNVHYISSVVPNKPFSATAKIRYKSSETKVKVIPITNNKVRVMFAENQRAITPGQAIVFYRGETVLGGGMIASSLSKGETT